MLSVCALALPKPAPVNEYSIHEDGGLVYDPLRREAESTGQLALYKNAKTEKHELNLGGCNLEFSVPKQITAYDVVPIKYKLSWKDDKPNFPLAVEATAFEDESRRKGRDLFDLALPGKLDLDVDYLGSITAHLIPGAKHNLKPDMSDTPGEYPGFERRQLARSGVVEAGDLVWFKFRYKNTGDTILDPEGMGGCQFYPELWQKNEKGKYEFVGNPYNLHIRDLEYLYPGESHEVWVHFKKNGKKETPQNFGLIPGEYLIKLRMVYRWYKDFHKWVNIWDGPAMYIYEMPFTVESKPRQVQVAEGKVTITDGGEPDKITRWIHTSEEFMTAFDCHIAEPNSASKSKSIEGTLHLQVAPWTEHVVVKLISADPVSIKSIAVPVDVDSDSLSIKFKPDHQMTMVKNGMREPVIWSQCMSDMRANVQHSPFPDIHIRERLREMMDCGVSITAFTAMPWLYDDKDSPKSNYQGDAWKYFLDCAREEGLMVEGWGTYPYDRPSIEGIYNWITGDTLKMERVKSYPVISHADPNLPKANAAAWLYQFHRWGDIYYQNEAGEVPVGIEDTRGWMRQDINMRQPEGALTIRAFQDWAKKKYGTIEAANAAWESSYKSFEDVDPEANQKPNEHGHPWEYADPTQPFHDWNAAIADFDEFRTELRAKNYADTLAIVRKDIPNVKFLLRTEGGNVIISGVDPTDPNTHMRHIYYSQRRNGIVAEVLQKTGEVRFHSDYTTMPYTPSELRKLVRTSVEQGIIPVYLPQLDNMRDVAINAKYGSDFQGHYNLPEPKFGQMMHSVVALYPWFKAVYEEGGVPGVLWEDYQCDGFVTETQKREMRFFKKKLQEALNTPEAKKARAANIKQPSQEWRKGSKTLRSYDLRALPKEGK